MVNALQNQFQRDISVVTGEIKELVRQGQQIAVAYAIEIGRRLVEAKSLLPYGEWTNWLKEEVEFSQSSANNFMKLFEEYGSEQISLLGAISNSQTIANLPYSKALKLIAIPAEEREAFAENVDAENISVKELEKAIRERNEAVEKNAQLEQALKDAQAAADDVNDISSEYNSLKDRIEELEAERDNLQKAAEEAEDKLQKALDNPTIPAKKLKEIKKDAEEKTSAAAEKKYSAEIEQLKAAANQALKDKEAAERKAELSQQALEEAQKQLKTASPVVTEFKTLFTGVNKTINQLKQMLETIKADDPETAEKLKAAMKALGEQLNEY